MNKPSSCQSLPNELVEPQKLDFEKVHSDIVFEVGNGFGTLLAFL